MSDEGFGLPLRTYRLPENVPVVHGRKTTFKKTPFRRVTDGAVLVSRCEMRMDLSAMKADGLKRLLGEGWTIQVSDGTLEFVSPSQP